MYNLFHHHLLSTNRNFRLAVAHEEMNPRKRNTMEDVHRIRQNLLGAVDDSYSYFGVYDGNQYIFIIH